MPKESKGRSQALRGQAVASIVHRSCTSTFMCVNPLTDCVLCTPIVR